MAGGFRVEMSADRHDRTRAVTTRLAKRHPTNRKSVCGSLRSISLLVFREGRNVAGPTPSDTGRQDRQSGSQLARDSKMYGRWVSEGVEMSEDRQLSPRGGESCLRGES